MRAAGVAALMFAGGCGQKELTVVGPCPDGGVVSGTLGCAPASLLDDLVGWWRLDDGTGSTIAYDSSTRGNDGTLVELAPATAWMTGRAAGGLAVDAYGYVNVAPSASIDSITDQVTISGWGYLESDTIADEYATIASREEAATIDQHYHIGFYRDRVPTTFVKTQDGTSIRRGPAPVPSRTWVHLAATYDGSIVRFYVNGQEVMNENLTGRFAPDTTPFLLGANNNGPMGITERFAGTIDEIMLYRRALSAAEIGQIYGGALFGAAFAPDAGARD